MARFEADIPTDLIEGLQELEDNSKVIFEEMTQESAKIVEANVRKNIQNKFNSGVDEILEHLKITKAYRTSDGSINTKVAFYGYMSHKGDWKRLNRKGPKGKVYTEHNRIAVPFVVIQKEYGNSRGEKKKPFFRKSFRKSEIQDKMNEVFEEKIGGKLNDK